MADRDSGTRLRLLAEASGEFKIDSNIPIRRYFRSGQEMIKMAEVYHDEGNLEAAYVLYLKYMTLFVEKLKTHRDYSQVLPTEKSKVKKVVKEVMVKTEDLKKILKNKFEEEHGDWLKEEQNRKWEEQREQKRREEEEEKLAEMRRLEEVASIERDRQVALWHQAQLDKEDRESRGVGIPTVPLPSVELVPEYVPSKETDRSVYDPTKYVDQPSAPPPADQDVSKYSRERPPSISPLPSFDRTAKPVNTIVTPPLSTTAGPSSSVSSTSSPVPTFDRSIKPAISSPTGLRTVVIPANLSEAFLAIARSNSDRGVETLGTLGGRLCKNRFVISHLLIPRQVGKSDSCTMEGLEDVWDIHDKENIIFLGWIHTHPAYSVFLSSVDMHNQYEWQHMLPEALAIVCSIKDSVVGNLRLTPAGMSEIGGCSLTNFHPHSKEPPLWEEATHVEVDTSSKVILKDLR